MCIRDRSYPHHIINNALRKAKNTFYTNPRRQDNTHTSYLPLPTTSHNMCKKFLPKSILVSSSNVLPFKKIFKPRTHSDSFTSQCVYKIPCANCNNLYIGETHDFPRRNYQHKYDLLQDNPNSALTLHRSTHDHNININHMTPIIHIDNLQLRKLSESLSLIHISEPTRLLSISYAVFCLKKKK